MTTPTVAASTPVESNSRSLAGSSLVSFAGSAISAIMGFALTVVLARTLGDAGSGIVLQAIAVVTIVLSVARAGMDSAGVWLLPRLAVDDPARVRGAVVFMVASAAGTGVVCAALVALLTPAIAAGTALPAEAVAAITLAGWFIPAGSALLVALAATRGLGGVLPYVAVGGIALPTARPVLVFVVALSGASYAAVTLAWAFPLPVALLAALLVVRSQVRRRETRARVVGSLRVDPTTRRLLLGYALPRTVSAVFEQSVIWLDVVIVGIVLGPAAAGIYGAASRFVTVGLVVDSALRVVVAPQLSALLHVGDSAGVQVLYRRAAAWLVLFATPAYLLLALYPNAVLGILGNSFLAGAATLQILCVGAILTFLAGNIHSVLLMSGRSGWGATNKAVALAINIAGNVALLPLIGIVGAAISWAASMLVDALLALVEVRRMLGIRAELRVVGYALAVPLVTIAIPAFAVRSVLGESLLSLALSAVLGGAALLVWCRLDRNRLQLNGIAHERRRRQ
jgi:O-antigen/teichoic acid export membrane protein